MSVVWNAGLTKENRNQIERVQKSVFSVILKMKTLVDRRKDLALKFAKKASAHPIHQTWFVKNQESNTRLKKSTFKPVCGRTERFLKSAIPYLTSLLNETK